jgi:hypothetical protein
MANSWIEFVKNYSITHQISYKNALKEAKTSYNSQQIEGGNIVRRLIGLKKADYSKIKKNPSKYVRTKQAILERTKEAELKRIKQDE